MDLAPHRGGAGKGASGGGFEGSAIMLGNDEKGHQITRASVMSLSTSSLTEATFLPPWRLAGSSTLRVMRRGAASTPSASGVITSIGFFLAFMILGSEA